MLAAMSVDGGYRTYAGDDIVTGEGVSVEVPVASVITRVASRLIDLVVTGVLLVVGVVAVALLTGAASEAVGRAAQIALVAGTTVILPALVETVTRGRTPGKYALGLRTVRDDGGPISLRHAVIRERVGFVEIWLLSGGPAVVAAVVHPRAKRLGDMAAGTHVVSVRHRLPATAPVQGVPALERWVRGADIGAFPSDLGVAVRQFLARAGTLTPDARQRLGTDLARQVLGHVAPAPPPGFHHEWLLRSVLAERRRRDAERLGAESDRTARLLPPDPLG